jgi:hypothetical protein
MPPAFPSTGRAAAFGGILLFFITLPVIVGSVKGVSREQMYRGISERAGAFDFIRRQIFEEHSDLDIAFCGSSLLGGAVDPRYVEQELSKALGRPAHVMLLPQSWQGPDMNYFVSRDLMEARRVKMLVLATPAWVQRSNQPHVQLFRIIRYGDHPGALDGLDLRHRLSIYADFVLGAPRQVLSLLRPNEIDPRTGLTTHYGTPEGYMGAPFVPHEVKATGPPADSMIYSDRTRGFFRFTGPALNEYQLHFLRKSVELVRAHGAMLVILHIASPSERGQETVMERQLVPEVLGDSVAMVGVPSARLFRDVPGSEFFDYYHDEHLNSNGMDLYTKAITPALIELYERNEQSK